MTTKNAEKKNGWIAGCQDCFFLIFLILYPLRHVTMGGDLWDIGYNYGNFQFGNIESMGQMWYFSTFLSNAAGKLLTILPFGHTLLGLNVYTGLFASLLAVLGYLFCTRELHVPKALTFAGEWMALSLCWCPTALLYNYITYVLFLICIILLYRGLTNNRKMLLFWAGICLGANVFVRFSNLPEMGLIVAVWAYEFWMGWQEKGREKEGGKWLSQALGKMVRDTLLCLAGYVTAFGIILLWIGIFYGLDSYVNGIRLLFAMTDTAADYKPTSMLYGLIWPLKESLYWLKRIAVFLAAGILFGTVMDYAPLCFGRGKRREAKAFSLIGMIGSTFLTGLLVFWLFLQREGDAPNFTSFYYTSYDPIFWPAILFLILAMGIGMIEVLRKDCPAKDRFLGVCVILMVLLTSIGSNNGMYPSMNNLFLVAPYVLGKLWQFTGWCGQRVSQKPKELSDFRLNPSASVQMLWACVLLCMVQFGMFGAIFSFCESTGQQEKGCFVSENPVLRGISMGAQRANWLEGISSYAMGHDYGNREVILHGDIPALAFYLQMRPWFHSWNDLDSFQYATMKETIDRRRGQLCTDLSKADRFWWGDLTAWPVVIADKAYAAYDAGEASEAGSDPRDLKWELIQDFMDWCDSDHAAYRMVYQNEKFVVWELLPKDGSQE